MKTDDPYLVALDLVKQNSGTSGQAALAKCILSLYNSQHAFSIGEVLGPLDARYTTVVLNMVVAYANHGETAELREAGRWVFENFPRLGELSEAMANARAVVHLEWERQHDNAPALNDLMSKHGFTREQQKVLMGNSGVYIDSIDSDLRTHKIIMGRTS